MNFSIQLAEEHHIPHIVAITNLEAKRSAATVSSSDEPIERWQNQYHQYRNFTPWLVALSQDSDSEEVIGYAKAAPYNARGGFMWSVSLSIYISEAYKGQRMGDALYTVLFDLLKRQGFINVYARIALPNPGSQRLHQRFGLKQTGVLPKFAWKFNTWHDMAIYTGMINETMNSNPTSLLSVEEAWQKRLNR